MGRWLKSGFLNVLAPRETLLINPTAFRSWRPSCTPGADRRRGVCRLKGCFLGSPDLPPIKARESGLWPPIPSEP